MKKNIFKKGASAVLALIMCLSTLFGVGTTTAFAAEGETDSVVMFSFPRDGDENYSGNWGHDELHYMNGWYTEKSSKVTVYTVGSWYGNACYCIEPGTPLAIDDQMTSRDETYWDNLPSTYNSTISADEIKLFIGRIFQYGYTGTVTTEWRSQNASDADKMAHLMATQLLVWETVVGERDSNFNHVDPGSYDAVLDRVADDHPLHDEIMAYYNSMVSSVQRHSKVPSFFAKSTAKAQEIDLEWNGTNYSAVLTDSNNVLGNYTFSADAEGISFSVDGNKLTITAEEAPAGTVSITATKTGSVRKGVVVWTDSVYAPGQGQQDLSTFTAEVNDPVRGYLRIGVSLGSAKIVKTSEDGVVSGVEFTITGNGVNQTVKTGSNGEITIDNLSPGTYTVTENTPGYYEPQQSQTVTVVSGKTATVSFSNVLKRSDLKVIKTSEDAFVEGIQFHLYGTSASGQKIDLYAETDATGVAMFSDVLIGSNYTLEEMDTAERYIVPDSQVAVIEWEKVTENSFYNELKRGDLKIVKTSEDGLVEGVKFHLYGTSLSGETVDAYAVTDASGVAIFEDILIGADYTVEEVDTAERYIVPESQGVVIDWNKVTEKSFHNELKRGDLTVQKTSEDGFITGVKFHLYGTSLSGFEVDVYAVTGEDGAAIFEDILIGSGYTLEEVDTAIKYVIPDAQTVDVRWNEVTGCSMENILKKWNLTVTKTDGEFGDAQGDATLEGAVYGIYKGGELVDTYTTDADGQFTTDYYVCDADWTLREITPSEGYLLDETTYAIGVEPGNYTVELNSEAIGVTETVLKGNISIIKHSDDGSTQIETPEEGAKFEIYLKASGSYADAKETERDVIICDENGFGQTKDLPYGVYVVHQVSGWDGRELMDDFEVYVSQDGATYRYLINNSNFESYIHIVKVDAETGNVIPYAGAAFKLFDPTGEMVTMTFTYPTPTTVDTFYTDENGTLVTPEKLPYGEGYFLVEVEAPYGYVLDSTPVYFDVTEENSESADGITLIKVNKENVAQKGTICITKTGEIFSDVSVENEIYQPVYGETALEGAVFEIRAAEDIVTPDGTVRYTKGTLVDTITTGADGIARTKELYLGKYEVKEITAPYGYVLSDEVHIAELIYAGQEIAVTETAVSLYNVRQTATLSILKVLETNDLFGIGNSSEIKDVVFGLYAGEEIVSTSGSAIPVDGLIEIITFDENGLATIQTDLPIGCYYVKEIATNEHYVLNSDKYEFAFEYGGQEIVSVTLAVNGGEPIENELIYGSVSGMKVTEDGDGLAGAVIGLFKQDEVSFTEDTALMLVTTGEDGSFHFENIPYGQWLVREIQQPEGFLLNETIYDVIVSENEQIIEIQIDNEFVTGSITLTKVDADYPENKLTGATFEVYLDTNADGLLDDGDVLLGNMTESEPGIYEMLDLRCGHYLVRETIAPNGFILDTGVYAVFIETDGAVYAVENEAGVGFINQAQVGNIRIEKTSEDGIVEGITFKVEGIDMAGNVYSQEFVTDENGEIHIEGLRIGDYVISEVSNDASARYILPDDITVTVHADKTVVAQFYNKLIPDNPKTGDSTNIALWGALAALSLIGVSVTGFVTFKKKKKEDK